MNEPGTRQRELRAIDAAVQNIKVEQALILCENNEEQQFVGDIPVSIRSIAEWLLD
jgi:hypothetical protein